jgi:DNA-binding transcriptional LysR family regulator
MEIAGLKYLLVVAEAGSLSAAARNLSVHVSTLSRCIWDIESELGVTLFEREHSGVRLTSTGQTVLVYVRQALADIEAITKVGRNGGVGRSGAVHLGVQTPVTHEAVRGLLTRWHHFYPDVLLILHELSEHEICAALEDRRLDAAILADFAVSQNLACEPLYQERLFAALPAFHPHAKADSVSWSALRKEVVLVQDWPQSHVARSFYGSLLGHSTQFISHPAGKHAILPLVASGFGITLVTESLAKNGYPGATFRPVAEDSAVVQFVIAWSPQSEDAAVGRFIAFIRDEAKHIL